MGVRVDVGVAESAAINASMRAVRATDVAVALRSIVGVYEGVAVRDGVGVKVGVNEGVIVRDGVAEAVSVYVGVREGV
jgi:hypothetical protein